MVRGERDEAFGHLVERDGYGCLESDGKEGVLGDVVMVGLLFVVLVFGRWDVS